MRLRQKLVDAADTIKGFFGAKKEQDSAVAKLEALRVSALQGLKLSEIYTHALRVCEAASMQPGAAAWPMMCCVASMCSCSMSQRKRPAISTTGGIHILSSWTWGQSTPLALKSVVITGLLLVLLLLLSALWLPMLQARTEEARELFRNPESTQFVIVTIPTQLAVSESARLAAALEAESVPVKTLVVNQVPPCLSHKFMQAVSRVLCEPNPKLEAGMLSTNEPLS